MNFEPMAYNSVMLAGVRRRRLFAWFFDACIVGIVTVSIWIALTIATLGFAWFLLPSLFPAVAVIYHALTVSGRRRGTYGMRALDLEVVTFESGARASLRPSRRAGDSVLSELGVSAAVHFHPGRQRKALPS